MPLNPRNTRTFYRTLYAQEMETVTLLKRKDDMLQGTVTKYKVFNCRHSVYTKTGESIEGEATSEFRVTWHIPQVELDRIGISYLNPLDRIIDKKGRYWQPESGETLTRKLWEGHYCVGCVSINPPKPTPGSLDFRG